MTFSNYFHEVQILITKWTDLPFDCPFPQTWIDEHTEEFEKYHHDGLRPLSSVMVHFMRINDRALLLKKLKVKKDKPKI